MTSAPATPEDVARYLFPHERAALIAIAGGDRLPGLGLVDFDLSGRPHLTEEGRAVLRAILQETPDA